MPNIEDLMFKEEHFPVRIGEVKLVTGERKYDFKRINIPPYHPSMKETGIDIELAKSLIDRVLEETVKDLEEAKEKIPRLKFKLNNLTYEPKTRKIRYNEIKEDNDSIWIDSFPIVDWLIISRYNIRLFGTDECSINDHKPTSFDIPKTVKFSSELMKEYEMRESGFLASGDIRIACPYCWYTHNVDDIDRIFLKNFIILYDNAVVKRKYT